MIRALFLSSFLILVSSFRASGQTIGQYEIRKRTSTGFTSYGVTLSNGQVLGQTAGVPAAITLSGGDAAVWGTITGTLANQTDLNSALSGKSPTAGSTSLTTLGTITTGTWQGTIIAPAYLGTGTSITTKFLRGDGTWQTVSGTGDALVSNPLSQFAATTSAQLRGVLSDESGTGEFLTTNGSAASLTSFPTLNQNTTGTAAGLSATLAIASGGTGSTTASDARTALGLAIGTNVQAYDAELGAVAALSNGVGFLKNNGSGGFSYVQSTAGGLAANAAQIVEYATGGAVQATVLYALSEGSTAPYTSLDPTKLYFVPSFGRSGALGTDTLTANRTWTLPDVTGTVALTSSNITGTAAGLSSTLAVASGGTGSTTASNARTALGLAIGSDVQSYSAILAAIVGGTWTGANSITTLGTVSTGTWQGSVIGPTYLGTGTSITTKYLRGDGTWQTISGGGDALVSNPLSQFAATTSAQLRGVLSDESGTGEFLTTNGSASSLTSIPVEIGIACSDETTSLTTGANKVTFRMPFAMTVTSVKASVGTAPTGAIIIVDINEFGSTIMTTNKLSIDASEETSATAATAAGITDSTLADDAEITIDIDQIGSTIAGAGLKIWIIGTR